IVHARRVVPNEEGLVGLLGIVAVEEVDDLGGDLLIHRLRSLKRQGTLVTASLVLFRAVGGFARDDWAWGRQTSCGLWVNGAGNVRKAWDGRVLAGRSDRLLKGRLVDVWEAHLLNRIEVRKITPILLEAMGSRQRGSVIAEVILSKLAGGVPEIDQELGERGSS